MLVVIENGLRQAFTILLTTLQSTGLRTLEIDFTPFGKKSNDQTNATYIHKCKWYIYSSAYIGDREVFSFVETFQTVYHDLFVTYFREP